MQCNFQENCKGEGAGAFKNIPEFSCRVEFIIGRRRNVNINYCFTWRYNVYVE